MQSCLYFLPPKYLSITSGHRFLDFLYCLGSSSCEGPSPCGAHPCCVSPASVCSSQSTALSKAWTFSPKSEGRKFLEQPQLHLWSFGPSRTPVHGGRVGGTVRGALCGFLLYLCGFAPEDGLCKAARGGLWVCGRWQLQSGLVVAGKCLSSCWDYWEVPVARAGKGWMSHLIHTHSFTFLEKGNQLTLAAQLFCELGAYWKDFNEYDRKGRHWDITKYRKYQIKEHLLRLPFTHTFPSCLEASPMSAAVGESLGFLKPAESMETSMME